MPPLRAADDAAGDVPTYAAAAMLNMINIIRHFRHAIIFAADVLSLQIAAIDAAAADFDDVPTLFHVDADVHYQILNTITPRGLPNIFAIAVPPGLPPPPHAATCCCH